MDAANVDKFLAELVGAGKTQAVFENVENQKRAAVEKLFEELTPEKKKEIKDGLTFTVVKGKKKGARSFSKDGMQENAVDTFGSTKRGYGISEKDQPRVQKAMEKIVDLTRKAIDKVKDLKTPDGRRVYDFGSEDSKVAEQARKSFTTFIELEVFTPLVREGIIPETLVLDDFSEVQKLLNATFKSYKSTIEEDRVDTEKKEGKMEADLYGGGSGLDTLKAIGGKAGQLKEHLLRKAMSEKTQKGFETTFKYAKQGGKTLIAFAKVGVEAKNWVPDDKGNVKNIVSQEKFLDPKGHLKNDKGEFTISEDRRTVGVVDEKGNPVMGDVGEQLTRVEGEEQLKKWSDDDLRVAMDQSKREALYTDYLQSVGKMLPFLPLDEKQSAELADKICNVLDNIVESDPSFYTQSGIDLLQTTVEGIIDTALTSYGIHTSREKIEELSKEFKARKAAVDVIDEMESIVKSVVVKKAGPPAGEAFAGLFSEKVDIDAFVAAASPKANGVELASIAAAGLQEVFTAVAPPLEPQFSIFIEAGQKAASVLRGASPGKEIEKALKNDPPKAFAPFVDATATAVEAGLTGDLLQILKDPEALKAIAAKAALPDEEAALNEIEQSEEEIKEYERTLVLIDEGGITAAEQRSLEKMIAQLQKDKQVLELVATLGGSLEGMASTSVSMANWALDGFTDVVAGEVCGALKAAKLIMQLTVNAIKAADRWALWYKFRKDLERSKKAVSSLSSTIQGFFNNKKEQIAFRTIEDALLAVQAAAAILGSIPEPYAMAVGKTMGIVAGAAQEARKLSEMIYTDVKLREAWTITKEALDNPRDRACGLKALRLNPTLGMHAIAWAAMEKTPPDPIARMFLNSVGVDEQTLAVSGSEEKVRAYLEELLYEDRKMVDPSKIKTNWAPETYVLGTKDWFVITSRAETDAVPKLRPGGAKAVLEALKKTDKHLMKKLETAANEGTIDEPDMKRMEGEALALISVLNSYRAVAADGSPHEEMQAIADEFLKLAGDHRDKLAALTVRNLKQRDPTNVINLLDGDIELLEMWFSDDGQPPVGVDVKTLDQSAEIVRGHLRDTRLLPAFNDVKDVQERLTKIDTLLENWELWKQINSLAPVVTRARSGKRTAPPKPEVVRN